MDWIGLLAVQGTLKSLLQNHSSKASILQHSSMGFPGGTMVKNYLPMQKIQETQVPFRGQEDPLEEEMATNSSILAWKIPWTE